MNPFWAPLAPYWAWIKVGIFAAICAGCYVYGGSNAKARAERECLAKENKALTQAIADNAKANDERRAAQKEVDRLAKLPPKVKEVIRANPSGCVLPKPVADAARVHVGAVNEAIRKDAVR